ncbi:MAG: hypothetical protein JHC54_00165 [Acinetobacter sp.]|nr:hypothetical protein [Acinetobacter sp.]
MNTYETIAIELEDKKDNDYVRAVRLHNQEAKRRRLAEELARYDLVVEADRLANLYFHNFEGEFAQSLPSTKDAYLFAVGKLATMNLTPDEKKIIRLKIIGG